MTEQRPRRIVDSEDEGLAEYLAELKASNATVDYAGIAALLSTPERPLTTNAVRLWQQRRRDAIARTGAAPARAMPGPVQTYGGSPAFSLHDVVAWALRRPPALLRWDPTATRPTPDGKSWVYGNVVATGASPDDPGRPPGDL